jgi:hypothetical protein
MSELETFFDVLLDGPGTGLGTPVFNPWHDFDPDMDIDCTAPLIRTDNLHRYLAARIGRVKLLVIAEAPGYRGAKFSGIAMTAERGLLATAGDLFGDGYFPGAKRRTSKPTTRWSNELGLTEPTATIVWSTMAQNHFAPHDFALWNAFPYHPHGPGDRMSNRRPTNIEVTAALPVLQAFLAVFPGCRIAATGEVAKEACADIGVEAVPLRHPSYGGAPEFRAGIKRIAAELLSAK